ncbi:MAG: hypothetical protein U9O95_05190 [Candidatus Marinimicrobia bacterium]|nr:hypothetical protein [Candidatus Neomarinimicrobiota bacterium]
MKKLVIIILVLLALGQVYGQTDRNGNPIFNSIYKKENVGKNYLLVYRYYTLKNNIENRKSSVFMAESPSLDLIEGAAINLPSDYFILTKKSKVVGIIGLLNYPRREFNFDLIRMEQRYTYPCKLNGDITENRAVEIVNNQYDPNAYIDGDVLHFNGKEFKIISNDDIENAVEILIKTKKLDKNRASKFRFISKKETEAYILSETKEGGKLDFFTEVKDKKYDGVQIIPGLFASYQSIAYYKWGRACYDLGVDTIEEVYGLYIKIKGETLNEQEEIYIKMGFNNEWD